MHDGDGIPAGHPAGTIGARGGKVGRIRRYDGPKHLAQGN